MSSVIPCRAPVRPRVISPVTGDTVLLEDEIAGLLESPQRCSVALWGPRCSGKTTALQHLAEVLPSERLLLVDDADVQTEEQLDPERFRVLVPQGRCAPDHVLLMAPWDIDDVLEYLMAVAPKRTASVMSRWQKSPDAELAEGLPEIVRLVIDRMIANDKIDSVHAALQDLFEQFLSNPDDLRRAGMFAVSTFIGMEATESLAEELKKRIPQRFLRILNPKGPRLVLAASHMMRAISSDHQVLNRQFPRELIQECALATNWVSGATDELLKILGNDPSLRHSMAVSILHAAGMPIRFAAGNEPYLAYAFLPRIQWKEASLKRAVLSFAKLSRADLSGANLDDSFLSSADLSFSCLHRASMCNAKGDDASLNGADLSDALMDGSTWGKAVFSGANLQRASLKHSKLCGADLSGADLTSVDFFSADLYFAKLDGANLQDADLTHATLRNANLREANLRGANFGWAVLVDCDLEGVQLHCPNFENAILQRALLTGSIMESPNFMRSDLRDTGLAHIQWPNADLRDADLRGASFHLGSTRSGLVGSPYPSHGTRTGFYTNEYDDQTYRAPEDIRKADLRGADLRGANITDVDFYLVDLRGAKYDDKQLEHLIRCDAILHDRMTT